MKQPLPSIYEREIHRRLNLLAINSKPSHLGSTMDYPHHHPAALGIGTTVKPKVNLVTMFRVILRMDHDKTTTPAGLPLYHSLQ